MRIRLTTVLLSLLLAVPGQAVMRAQVARAQDFPPTSPAPVVASTRQHAFVIPFRIEPARNPQDEPVEVQLHVSSDQGATWNVADRVKPAKGNFVYRAPHDGEYWYAIRTVDGQGVTRPAGHLQAQLKVVVDTVAPRLDLTARRGAAGEIVVRWQAVDPYLKPTSLKLEYQSTAGGPDDGAVTVRADIPDASGNPAVSQAIVQDDPNLTPPGAHLTSNLRPGADADRSSSAEQWPADRATADPLGHGAGFDKRTESDTADSPYDWRGTTRRPTEPAAPPYEPPQAPLQTQTPTQPSTQAPTQAPTRAAPRVQRDPSRPSPLDFGLLPVGQRPRMVNSRTFELQYELDSVGTSGVGRVELWGTLDGGRNWSVYGVDSDNRSPVPVRVEREGIYGFRIVAQSGTGLSGPKPAPGDEADVWIGVDLAEPVGRITAVEVSEDGAELVVTWEVGDDALEVTPVTLEFAESRQGPWTPIASGLENSGSYSWTVEKRVGPAIYVRMIVRDEAGNVGTFFWDKQVSLDRSRPQGRIHDVRAIGR